MQAFYSTSFFQFSPAIFKEGDNRRIFRPIIDVARSFSENLFLTIHNVWIRITLQIDKKGKAKNNFSIQPEGSNND